GAARARGRGPRRARARCRRWPPAACSSWVNRSDWQASQDSNLEHAVLETAALPLELLACGARLLRLLVLGVLAATGAELRQHQLVGHGPLVIRGGVVALRAHRHSSVMMVRF